MVRNPLSSVIVLVAVISARMIMAPLPSATAAGRGAAQHPRLEWVSASDVDQAQLAMLPSPVELDSYSNTHVVPQVDAATVPDPDLKQQCQSHAEADTPKGWIKSRFEVCIHRPKDLVLRPIGGGDPIGRLQFDEWVLGFAVDGTREIDYVASVENIIVQNLGSDPDTWQIGLEFFHSSTGSGILTAPTSEERDDLLAAWVSVPQWTLTYTSPNGSGDGPFKTLSADIQVDTTISSPGVDGFLEIGSGVSNIRFDSAGAVAGKFNGAVFTDAHVVFTLRACLRCAWPVVGPGRWVGREACTEGVPV